MDTKRVVTTFSYWLHQEMSLQHQWQFDIGPMFVGEDFEEPNPVLPGGDGGGGGGGGEQPGLANEPGGGGGGGGEQPDLANEPMRVEMQPVELIPTVGVLDGERGGSDVSRGQTTDIRETENVQTGIILPDATSPPAQVDKLSDLPPTTSHGPVRGQVQPVIPGLVTMTNSSLPNPAPSPLLADTGHASNSQPGTMNLRSSRYRVSSVQTIEDLGGKAFKGLVKIAFKILKVTRSPDNPTVKQALSSKQKLQWREAINKELQQLRDMEVYSLVDSFPP